MTNGFPLGAITHVMRGERSLIETRDRAGLVEGAKQLIASIKSTLSASMCVCVYLNE